ncbi:MAG: Xaa-Pro peptidase family protein [Dysgonamonadaceae bacterium]|jgi:Xaa-Pro aminopeptidase|nr:Xaa-Pro peptidase family protein [Dysgonamonadaceae bacterium]
MNPINIPPKQDLEIKWRRLQQAMHAHNLDACLIGSNVHLYYLTGTIFSGYFYLSVQEPPLCFTKRAGFLRDDIEHCMIRKPEDIPDVLTQTGRALPQRLMLEGDQITYNEYMRLQRIFNTCTSVHVSDSVSNNVSADATAILRQLRMIKTPWEIGQLRTSAKIQAEVQALIPACYRPGISDIEFQAAIEKIARLQGSLGIFRGFGNNMEIHMGSVLAGENAEAPSPYDFALGGEGIHPAAPIGANGTILHPGTSVMVDIGGAYTAYISDMTRTYAIGKLPDIACKAHQVSIEIQEYFLQTARPGTFCADLYNHSLEMAKKAGLDAYFMGTASQAKFVGHGLGIEINEPPVLTSRSKDFLQENMTFALEPKFVLPKIGAVGVENTWLVTAGGLEKLTVFPEELMELKT